MKKEKIVFVTKALWIGGIETALVNLLNHFHYDKYDVTLLVLQAELNLLEQINPKCRVLIADREKRYSFGESYKFAKLYHLVEPAEHPSLLHRMLMWTTPFIRWFENRRYIQYVRNQISEKQFDTCIIYSDVAAETAIRAINAKRYLMYYHHGAMRHVYHDGIAYKRCEKIIAVSQNQARELKKFVPAVAEKVVVVHNLTDIDGVKAKAMLPMDDQFDQERYNIVSVGRISPEKGMDIAVQACAKLVQAGIETVCWWIVGDGPAMGDVKRTVTRLHMEPYINLVGMKDNPYPYIRQADLYVQPSRVESFGLTITEALILGKPVVATRTQGACEILTDHVNGFLSEVDADALARLIQQLCTDAICSGKLEQGQVDKVYAAENATSIKKLEEML